eukprot:403366299
MNSYLTNDTSCHSTYNAVPKQSLSTIESYLKKSMFILKLHLYLRVQNTLTATSEQTSTEICDNFQAEHDQLKMENLDSNVKSLLKENCVDIAIKSCAQRAITSQQSTLESNILSYEEDLEMSQMLYYYVRMCQRLKNISQTNTSESQDQNQVGFESKLSLSSKILQIYGDKDIDISAVTSLMEALLNYRKNGQFYDTYQEVVTRLTRDDCINNQKDLHNFFGVTAKAIMLTKSAHKGVLMIKLMSELNIPVLVESHLNPVIEGCFRNGKQNLVQEAVHNAKRTDFLASSTLKIFVKYYSRLNQTQTALQYFHQLQQTSQAQNDPTYYQTVNQMLDSLLKAELFEEAEQIYNKVFTLSKDQPNCMDMMTFSCMIKGYCRAQRLPQALNVLSIMKERGIKPDEVLYNSIIDGCSKNNQIAKAFLLYDEMLGEGVTPTTITFNSLIDCCVRSGNQDQAWRVLEQMKEKQVKPDNYTYSTLFKGIKSENQRQDLEKAFVLYNQLQNSNDFTPDEILFNVLLDACINCKQLDRAVELFKQLKPQSQPQIQVSNTDDADNSLSLEDSPDSAKNAPAVVNSSNHHFMRPDEISFNTIIKGCAQEKKLQLAFEMFNLMKMQCLKPNDVTYNSLIDACVRCNRLNSAWQLLSEMQQNNIVPDNFTYSTLIKGIRAENQSQNGISNPMDLEKAFALLEQMKQSNGGVKPDEILYNCLIDACVRFHDVNRAVAVFQEMQFSNIKPSSVTYGILIKAYGSANQLDNAFFVFKKMKDNCLIPNSVTYGCLIDACVKNNQIERAMEVFETMKRDGVQLNTIIFTTLIKGFAKSFKLDQALEVYQIMKMDDKIKPNNVTFNSLIDCCIRCNSIKKAMEIFEEMKQPISHTKPDLITYSTMIKGFCREKNIQQALIMLNDMEKNNIMADEVLYNSLLDGCCKANEIEMALKVYKNMEILKIKPSNVTYSILIKIYGKQRNLPKALGVLEEMKKDGIRPGLIVYTCLLQTCIKSRQLKTAEQLFHDMRIQGIRGDQLTYQTMINGCLYSQKFDSILILLKDASDSKVQLPHELSQNILTELNKWNTDNHQMKQEITQHVLVYLDQKENYSFNQNNFQKHFNHQNNSYNHGFGRNQNKTFNNGMTNQSFNTNQMLSSVSKNLNSADSDEFEIKSGQVGSRKGFFNSSRQNKTEDQLPDQSPQVSDFTTHDQPTKPAFQQSIDQSLANDQLKTAISNQDASKLSLTSHTTNQSSQSHVKVNDSTYQTHNTHRQVHSNQNSHYQQNSTNSGKSYSKHQDYSYGKQNSSSYYPEASYDEYSGYAKNFNNQNSRNSGNYQNNSYNNQSQGGMQQPNTQSVFVNHQKNNQYRGGNTSNNYNRYENNANGYENNQQQQQYYDKENYNPNPNYYKNGKITGGNQIYHKNQHHGYGQSQGYNQGYY